MKSFGMTLNLKSDPGVVDNYVEYHEAVWPDVLAGLGGIGISRMKIFLHGLRLFMYMEKGRAKEWDELMRTFQEPVPGAASGEWWAEMEEVFDLERG